MFDFKNLEVYKKSKDVYCLIDCFLKKNSWVDQYIRYQLKRASISMVINIAEGSGKFSKADRRNYYTISRGSVYECVSLLDLIGINGFNSDPDLMRINDRLVEVSKMLFGLIKSQK